MNYKKRKSITCLLLIICFVFSTVLFCYADNYKYNGNTEKKDYSFFSDKTEFYICLPHEKLNEVSPSRYCFVSDTAFKYNSCDTARTKHSKMMRTVSLVSKTSEDIVQGIYKKDGKK